MTDSPLPRRPPYVAPLVALGAGALYFLFHLHYLSRYLDTDQVVYLWNAQSGALYNPHHLLFDPSGGYFHEAVVKYFGEYGFTDYLVNMRLRSVLFASLGVAAACLYLVRLSGSLTLGLGGALLFGSFHGYLNYAAKVDTGIYPVAWLPVALLAGHGLYRARRSIKLVLPLTAVILFAGVLIHQYMVILCAAVAVGLLIPRAVLERRPRGPIVISRAKPDRAQDADHGPSAENTRALPYIERSFSRGVVAALALTVLVALPVAASYFYAGAVVYRLPISKEFNLGSPRGYWKNFTFQKWLFAYRVGAEWAGWATGFKEFKPEAPLRGLTDAIVTQRRLSEKYNFNFKFNYDFSSGVEARSFAHNTGFVFFVFALITPLFFRRGLARRYGRDPLALFVAQAGALALAIYWVPHYLEFWLLPMGIATLLGCLTLHYLGEHASRLLGGFGFPRALSTGLIVTTALVIGLHNLRWYVVPHSRIIIREGMGLWTHIPHYYERWDHTKVYKNPLNPYETVYGTRPGRYGVAAPGAEKESPRRSK